MTSSKLSIFRQLFCSGLVGFLGTQFAIANEAEPWQPDVEIVDEIDNGSCLYGGIGGGYSAMQKIHARSVREVISPADNGFIDASFGCSIMGWGRGEAEFGYRFKSSFHGTPNFAAGSVQSFTGFGNIWIEPIEIGRGVKPYLGGGIGFASHKFKTNSAQFSFANDWKSRFAWQVGAGLGVDLIENVTLDFGYRYKDLGSASSHGFGDITAHEARAGLRIRFGGLL